MEEYTIFCKTTVFRRKKLLGYLAFWCIFAIPSLIYCLMTKEYRMLFCPVFFFALPVFLRNSFRKEYIQANSLEYGEKMWSPHRTITVTEDGVTIFASYLSEKPDVYETDPEYRQFQDEMDAEMSVRQFSFRKIRVYESETIFLIYRSRDKNQAVPKKYFQEEEIQALRTDFAEKLGKNYITLCMEKG